MACCRRTVPSTATSILESYASCLDPVYVRKTSFCKPNRESVIRTGMPSAPCCSPIRFIRTRSLALVG